MVVAITCIIQLSKVTLAGLPFHASSVVVSICHAKLLVLESVKFFSRENVSVKPERQG